MFWVLLAITCCLNMANGLSETGAFTSSVNFEKLYTMEDEILALTDVILNHERSLHGHDDVHGINNVTEIVNKVKEIHRDVVSNKLVSSYITHPVNMLHLTKRLAKNWTRVIAVLENSKSCVKAMRAKIENVADNLPTGKDVQMISYGILRLQALYNISATDVMSGNILQTSAYSPFSLEDAFDLARIAYETKFFFLAIDWLKLVTSRYDPDIASFKLTNALNLMSSAYLKIKQPTEAMATLDEVLRLDPNNEIAKRNSRYVIMKIDEGLTDRDVKQQNFKRKKDKLLQRYCKNTTRVSPTGRGQFCTYTRWRTMDIFEKPTLKTEVLSIKPLVVLFHNFTSKNQQKAIAYMGYEQMTATVAKNRYSNPSGISGYTVEDRTYWQWIPKLKTSLANIRITVRKPQTSQFVVRNIGLDGHENFALDQTERTRLGTYLVFLTEPNYGGGDVVFTKLRTKVTPRKGDVLFYERTAHKQATICPVISDSIWVGVYPVHEPLLFENVCYADRLIRPKPV